MLLLVTACTSSVKAPVYSPNARGGVAAAGGSRSKTPVYHIVQTGDTLYSIAWRYGLDFKDVAAWNGIRSPYVIYPKQRIRLKPLSSRYLHKAPTTSRQSSRASREKGAGATAPRKSEKSAPATAIQWHWPTAGKIVKLNLPTTEQGLNISGTVGQEVKAAAGGEVVYSGGGLLGYGKLIIIKHNDTYLSAYAHNNRILVEEGMKVTSGQKIATMGIGNNGKPLLHFEIRKDGKPVDPRQYLPPHRS